MLSIIDPVYISFKRKDLEKLKELIAEIDDDRHRINTNALDAIGDILEQYPL